MSIVLAKSQLWIWWSSSPPSHSTHKLIKEISIFIIYLQRVTVWELHGSVPGFIIRSGVRKKNSIVQGAKGALALSLNAPEASKPLFSSLEFPKHQISQATLQISFLLTLCPIDVLDQLHYSWKLHSNTSGGHLDSRKLMKTL